jgi:hypothetical protein
MTQEEAVRTNLDLLNEFMKDAFDSPQVLDQIPAGAEAIILPLDDPAMMRANRQMADASVKAGKPVVLVKFQKPKMAEAELELLTG